MFTILAFVRFTYLQIEYCLNKMRVTFCLVLLICIVTCQKRPRIPQEKIPKELQCYRKGFFKCQTGVQRARLQAICSELKGYNRIAVPIPKNRPEFKKFNGSCPPLGYVFEKVNLTEVGLPDCPCKDGNGVSNLHVEIYITILTFTSLRSYGVPLSCCPEGFKNLQHFIQDASVCVTHCLYPYFSSMTFTNEQVIHHFLHR